MDNFELGRGRIKDKKERLYKFVNKLVEDEVSWNRMKACINEIKLRRNKDLFKNNVT